MPLLVVVRPLTGTLRCAACHDDLAGRSFTCPGCKAVLHRDCRAELRRCPTYGCSVTIGGRAATQVAARQRPQSRLLFHLVWLVPGLLSFLWPLWFVLLGADDPVTLAFGLIVGPLVGHAALAPIARSDDDPGSPHTRALLAEVIGFGASLPAIPLVLLALVLKAWS